jgi:hypothetical protein
MEMTQLYSEKDDKLKYKVQAEKQPALNLLPIKQQYTSPQPTHYARRSLQRK